MHTAEFVKPDGRKLTLYGLEPLEVTSGIPSPGPEAVDARTVMRWHPLRGEWVMYAAHRLGRTFLPPPEYNPLAPTSDPEHPTELPRGNYDIAVFDNRFPSLTLSAPEPDPGPALTRDAVEAFLQKVPEHVVVVLDEAYREFIALAVRQPDAPAPPSCRPCTCAAPSAPASSGSSE